MAFENYFSRVVALRQDADQFMVGNDQQGADPVLGHFLNRFVDRLAGLDRQNSILVFALQHHFNCVGKFHQTSSLMQFLTGSRSENGLSLAPRNRTVLDSSAALEPWSRLNRWYKGADNQ